MRCRRNGCGQPVPAGRRKYCSDACRERATIENRKTAHERRRALRRQSRRSLIKMRTCLGCGSKFESSGPWNRFCEECANRNARVNGLRYSISGEWPDYLRGDLINDT